MDETMTARPQLLKQANLSRIRRAIKTKGTATRAEIAAETKISSTTVRSLLTEMLENGEIRSIGHDESSGGRKAERYALKEDRYYCAAICITGGQAYGLLVNICGGIVEEVRLHLTDGDFEAAAVGFLDGLTERREIKSIGVGVPGIVDGGAFWRKKEDGGLYRIGLGEALAERYGIPVIMENDLNAAAVGFGLCYERNFPEVGLENTNMVYLYFERDCISAGIIAGGRILRGNGNFAGELGLVPMEDGRLLDEWLAEPMDDAAYVKLITRILCWICGILNPEYITLGGPALRRNCIGPAGDMADALLPKHMAAQILDSPDIQHDYHAGMAYLAAGKMFDDVQFVKEQLCY